jgi:predicted RNA-binding Zn-ribbon protein involved in translation (DUF1610 family)
VYSSLWIAATSDDDLIGRLLSSHPPVDERIRRLMEMDKAVGKRIDASFVDSRYHTHRVRTLRQRGVAAELRCEECNALIALEPSTLRHGTHICPTCGQTIPTRQIYAMLKAASQDLTCLRTSGRTAIELRPDRRSSSNPEQPKAVPPDIRVIYRDGPGLPNIIDGIVTYNRPETGYGRS